MFTSTRCDFLSHILSKMAGRTGVTCAASGGCLGPSLPPVYYWKFGFTDRAYSITVSSHGCLALHIIKELCTSRIQNALSEHVLPRRKVPEDSSRGKRCPVDRGDARLPRRRCQGSGAGVAGRIHVEYASHGCACVSIMARPPPVTPHPDTLLGKKARWVGMHFQQPSSSTVQNSVGSAWSEVGAWVRSMTPQLHGRSQHGLVQATGFAFPTATLPSVCTACFEAC